MENIIEGYSKLNAKEKINALPIGDEFKQTLLSEYSNNASVNKVVDKLSENTISHFSFPMGIAPNMCINSKRYFIPLVTEESSVVAAISKAAKFWAKHGGFKADILGTEKKGQVHFFWYGSKELLLKKELALLEFIQLRVNAVSRSMKKRGGGVTNIKLIDFTHQLKGYFQLDASFETKDAMGANFINTCLEDMAKSLKQFAACDQTIDAELLEVNMAILSNYVPNCKVKASVNCPTNAINEIGENSGIKNLALKMHQAIEIANIDVSRAVTHNKGILNGIDAVALASGNDWRAIESNAHSYAFKNNIYSSLSKSTLSENTFSMELEIPISVGTVGGVTSIHPTAKAAMEILGNPNAEELMKIMACVGLASNFSAILALTSSGIQKGHMKMHLSNILSSIESSDEEEAMAFEHFKGKTVSHSSVVDYIKSLRKS